MDSPRDPDQTAEAQVMSIEEAPPRVRREHYRRERRNSVLAGFVLFAVAFGAGYGLWMLARHLRSS